MRSSFLGAPLPSPAVPPDRHPYRAAIVFAIAAVAAGMLYSMVLLPRATDYRGWTPGKDAWVPMKAAHYVAAGALGYVYEADEAFVATPGFPIAIAPLAWVGDRFGLTEGGGPIPAPYPTMWLIYGPLGYGVGTFLMLWQLRRLDVRVRRERAERAANSAALGPVWVQAAALVLVIGPFSIIYGHFEEPLAVTFLLWSIWSLLDARPLRAGFLFSLSITMKQWTAVVLPVFLAFQRVQRWRTAVLSLALPVALAAFTLLVDPQHAVPALFASRAFPEFGRSQLWIDPAPEEVFANGFRMALLVVALIVAWRTWDRADPGVLLAGMTVVLSARMFVEPVVYATYVAPAILFALLTERAEGGSGWRAVGIGSLLTAGFLIRGPLIAWWAVMAVLMLALVWPALRRVFARAAVPVAG